MMAQELTKQDILELFAQSDRRFEERLAKEAAEREKSRQAFEEQLAKEAAEREKSRKEFDKRIGEIAGTWGRFVHEMVEPNILELFKARGIELTSSFSKVKQKKDGQPFYEIDMLLVNNMYVVAVEVKSTLNVADVDEHLERLDKIRTCPPDRFDFTGISLLGAVAGMIIDQNADWYAMKQGLYVLRQAGNLIEIANDASFTPKEWKVG